MSDLAQLGPLGQLRILGMMTGTSSDGIDLCQITITPEYWEADWSVTYSYPTALRKRVFQLQNPGARVTLAELMKLHRDLGVWYGKTALKAIKSKADGEAGPDVIANHGQTVFHSSQSESGTTLQLGDPSHIAKETGCTIISNFREGDMAGGGEGAPLAPLFHKILLQGIQAEGQSVNSGPVSILNLGGIANLTYVTKEGEIIAFDTGPSNVWIDAAVERVSRGKEKFDRGGKRAAKGSPDEAALKKLLKLPYLRRKPPRSTGRDDFPFSRFTSQTRARGNDLVATAAELTARSVADAYRRFIIDAGHALEGVLVTGGGAKNAFLLKRIEALLGVSVTPIRKYGIDPSYIEAQAFAILGFFTLLGHSLGGTWTGAAPGSAPARILPGRNWAEVLERLEAFSSGTSVG